MDSRQLFVTVLLDSKDGTQRARCLPGWFLLESFLNTGHYPIPQFSAFIKWKNKEIEKTMTSYVGLVIKILLAWIRSILIYIKSVQHSIIPATSARDQLHVVDIYRFAKRDPCAIEAIPIAEIKNANCSSQGIWVKSPLTAGSFIRFPNPVCISFTGSKNDHQNQRTKYQVH